MAQITQLKELHVMNKLYFIIISFTLFNCSGEQKKKLNKQNDYEIINYIIKKANQGNKDIELDINNDNSLVLSLIDSISKLEKDGYKNKADSIKYDVGILKRNFYLKTPKAKQIDSTFKSIFNHKEYDYFLSQKEDSTWDFSKIQLKKTDSISNTEKLKLSKPIYTKDGKFALVFVGMSTRSFISIYKNEDEKWIEYSLIQPKHFQIKTNIFSYD